MFLCNQLDAQNQCVQWVVYQPSVNVFDELNNLSFSDVSAIWGQILLLFAVAYVFKHLPFFIRRK